MVPTTAHAQEVTQTWTTDTPNSISNPPTTNGGNINSADVKTTFTNAYGGLNVTANVTNGANAVRNNAFILSAANQSAYNATAAMFIGNPDPKTLLSFDPITWSAGCNGDTPGTQPNRNLNGPCDNTGVLTLKFSKAITDPVMDLSGLGGSFACAATGPSAANTSGCKQPDDYSGSGSYARGSYNDTQLQMLTPGVTFSSLSAGSTNLQLTENGSKLGVINHVLNNTCDAAGAAAKKGQLLTVRNADGSTSTVPGTETPTLATAGCGSVIVKGTFTELKIQLNTFATKVSSASDSGTLFKKYVDTGANGDNTSSPNPAGGIGSNGDLYRFTLRLPDMVSVGDRVFADANGSGIQDADEKGIAGATVKLLHPDGTPVVGDDGTTPLTTTTDANGNYQFPYLAAGEQYRIAFDVPAGYAGLTQAKVGSDSTVDSDPDPVTKQTDVFTATLGDKTVNAKNPLGLDMPGFDAGMLALPALGDTVFLDNNGNGVQDANDPGIQGIKVNLLDKNGNPVNGPNGQPLTQTTDANGKYAFTNLQPGDYIVEFVKPDGSKFTQKGNDPKADKDSNANPVTGRSDVVTLKAGEINNTIDAGILPPPAALGDYVFEDTNGNGVQDANEPAIPGVKVTLTHPDGSEVIDLDGAIVDPETTDANGKYEFTHLAPGDYVVTFTAPDGRKFTKQGTDPASNTDSNPGANGKTGTITLKPGETNNTIDAGILPKPAALGDFVFEDTNGNGTQDANEPGIAGVKVNLLDKNGNPVNGPDGQPLTTTTDANGKYAFTDLLPGDYVVQFVAPAGQKFTKQGTDPASNTDSNAGTDGKTASVTLKAGDTNNTIDAGILPKPASLGDTVFLDSDGNGVQGANEPGIKGVKVNLLDKNGKPVNGPDGQPLTVTTDDNGKYAFTDLLPGDYIVEFIAPNGAKFTKQGTDPAADKDSNANPATGRTAPVTLKAGDTNNTIDAGILPEPAALGDFVFEDTNGNGTQDAGEPGIAGVKVELAHADGTPVTDLSGNPVVAATTDANGKYAFTNLSAGDYVVTFTAPDGQKFTKQGTDPANGSDSNVGANGKTGTVTLKAGDTNNTIDAGILPKPATIGDTVFLDNNGNGKQDDNEPGIQGVKVNLLDKDGKPVNGPDGQPLTVATDANGKYTFTDLLPGTYTVEFVAPNGQKFTTKGTDPAADKDSNVDPATGKTDPVTVKAGDTNNTIDAGILPLPAALGDFVFEDTNGNGTQDAGEPGIAGVKVNLLDKDGKPVNGPDGQPLTTTTDANGMYSFTNLLPGDYVVQFVGPEGQAFTKQGTDPANGKDSNAGADGKTAPVTLKAGETNNTVDAGILPKPATIGDTVFEDTNGNGKQDDGEPGIAGLKVTLTKADGTPATDLLGNPVPEATTDQDGKYSFTNLPAGDYIVNFNKPDGQSFTNKGTDPAADKDSNADQTTGKSDKVTVKAGDTNNTIDAGILPLPAALGDFVFEDTNGNGIQDASEPGLAGVTVTLLDKDGKPANDQFGKPVPPATTDANGKYSFTGLLPGSYTVQVTAPAGQSFTKQGTDPASNTDSNTGTDGKTAQVTLKAGETNNTIDAGILPKPATIGDTVFTDNNGDGKQGDNEPGTPGVTVNLLDKDGNPAKDQFGNLIPAATTDKDGKYSFGNLLPGTYTVEFVKPAGTAFSPKGTDPAADKDSNADPKTGKSDPVTVKAGETNNTVDAGLIPLATLGDFVFGDKNGNGIQDPNESGIAGVTVNLLDKDGKPVLGADGKPLTTVTDANGKYTFTDLLPGSYIVEFVKPAGLVFSKQGTDPAASNDSKADVTTGRSGVVTLGAGENNPRIDAGLLAVGNIAGVIYNDTNGNGKQDPNEPGFPGVTVVLKDANGNEVARTVTDANGAYTFTGIPVGEGYTVSVSNPPAGLNLKETAGKISVVANQTAGANNFGYTTTAPNGDLPDTGVNGTIGFTAAGGGLLIIGGLLLLVFRRPRRS